MIHKTLTLVDPITSKEIARAIKHYFKLYRTIPRTIRIINGTHLTKFDVKAILQQIKRTKGKPNNGMRIVADHWSNNTKHAKQYKKHRYIH